MKLQWFLLLNIFKFGSVAIASILAFVSQVSAQAMPSIKSTEAKQDDIHKIAFNEDSGCLPITLPVKNLINTSCLLGDHGLLTESWMQTSPSSLYLAQTLDADDLDLEPSIIEDSPVLQRWLEETPDILEDIRHDPAFRTRIRLAYAEIDGDSGIQIGVEDIFLGKTRMTLNAEYEETFGSDRQSWGMNMRYYTLPLGNQVNLSPLVGYRELETPDDYIDGVEIGLRLLFVPSRTAAADASVTQSWINPGGDRQETSLTTFTAGYALTQDVRLSSDIQIQVTSERQDTQFSLGLEFML